jgi:hypothetical protein
MIANRSDRVEALRKIIDAEVVIWKFNYQNSFIDKCNQDELAILHADIQDAIDGVIEDWEGRE